MKTMQYQRFLDNMKMQGGEPLFGFKCLCKNV